MKNSFATEYVEKSTNKLINNLYYTNETLLMCMQA